MTVPPAAKLPCSRIRIILPSKFAQAINANVATDRINNAKNLIFMVYNLAGNNGKT